MPPPSKPPAAAQPSNPHYRVRTDHVDRLGKISLRGAGRMHHLGVGAAHKGQAVTILIDADTVTVIHYDTGEVLSEHRQRTADSGTVTGLTDEIATLRTALDALADKGTVG